MTVETSFGVALRHLRTQRNFSQEELANRSGLHRTYISLLERGIKSPSLSTLFRLAEALETTPHEIVKLTEDGLLTVESGM